MRSTVAALFASALAFAACAPACAGSLQVEPVLVDITAPGAASSVTVRNEGTEPINAQIRVFKWSIVNGKEQLNPTDDVVASPPSVTLTPKGQYVVRIVRTSKQPVVGEESYRLLVDQLPDLSQQRNGSVNLMVRYSIPVFFGATNRKNPTVAWSVATSGDKITLTAHNTGDRRLRISALSLSNNDSGKNLSFGNGLAGYALGQSTVSWTVPRQGFPASGSVSVRAQSDGGPIQAVASIANR
jgi:fimbrial chaperone protein